MVGWENHPNFSDWRNLGPHLGAQNFLEVDPYFPLDDERSITIKYIPAENGDEDGGRIVFTSRLFEYQVGGGSLGGDFGRIKNGTEFTLAVSLGAKDMELDAHFMGLNDPFAGEEYYQVVEQFDYYPIKEEKV